MKGSRLEAARAEGADESTPWGNAPTTWSLRVGGHAEAGASATVEGHAAANAETTPAGDVQDVEVPHGLRVTVWATPMRAGTMMEGPGGMKSVVATAPRTS